MFRNVNGKLGTMRKAVDWTIYPPDANKPNEVVIQSDKRIARINLTTGKLMLSNGKGHPGFVALMAALGAKEYDVPQWVRDQLAELDEDHGKMESGPVTVMDGNGVAPTVLARSAQVPEGAINIMDLL